MATLPNSPYDQYLFLAEIDFVVDTNPVTHVVNLRVAPLHEEYVVLTVRGNDFQLTKPEHGLSASVIGVMQHDWETLNRGKYRAISYEEAPDQLPDPFQSPDCT